MRRTLDSVGAQSIPPARWIVVDDGSTDETAAVLAEYAASLPFLEVVRREDRGTRSVGPGVIDAFYAGLERVRIEDFDYLCKLDMDLVLPRGYFERLMGLMEADPRLGTCSGKAYFPGPGNDSAGFDGALISEGIGDEVSVGASKFYRVACFRQIGGFVREVMWDGIDCHRCRMLGWKACSLDEPGLRFIHLRPMGSSHKGLWTGRVRWGRGQYFLGTGPVYMLASAVYRMARRPLVIGGIAMMYGYLRAAAAGGTRYGDPEFRRFVRRFQWSCLIRGKAEATRRADERQGAVWRGARSTVEAGAHRLRGEEGVGSEGEVGRVVGGTVGGTT